MNPFLSFALVSAGFYALFETMKPSKKAQKKVNGAERNGAKRDVIISTMGLRRGTADAVGLEDWLLIEWPGDASRGGHPTWSTLGPRYRDQNGDMLPRFLRNHRVEPSQIGRLLLVGFSAGSNSGLRQLLKSRGDRAKVDYVFSIDGFHANRKPQSQWGDTVESRYWDWGQVEPFALYARRAARGTGVLFASASDVAAPTSTTTKTRDAWQDVIEWLETDLAKKGQPAEPEPLSSVGSHSFPHAPHEWGYKVRNLLINAYGGVDAAAHIAQANEVTPYFLENWLIPKYVEGTDVA